MPPLHVFPLPEGSLNALPRVLRAPETDQPHLRANASIAAPTPFSGMGGRVAWAVVVAAYSNHSTLPNLSLTYIYIYKYIYTQTTQAHSLFLAPPALSLHEEKKQHKDGTSQSHAGAWSPVPTWGQNDCIMAIMDMCVFLGQEVVAESVMQLCMLHHGMTGGVGR